MSGGARPAIARYSAATSAGDVVTLVLDKPVAPAIDCPRITSAASSPAEPAPPPFPCVVLAVTYDDGVDPGGSEQAVEDNDCCNAEAPEPPSARCSGCAAIRSRAGGADRTLADSRRAGWESTAQRLADGHALAASLGAVFCHVHRIKGENAYEGYSPCFRVLHDRHRLWVAAQPPLAARNARSRRVKHACSVQ